VVHALLSLQSRMAPPQLPPAHASLTVQLLPSSHGAALKMLVQPDFASQTSVVQMLPSSHVIASAPGTHSPPLQVSPTVQTLSSLHGAARAA